MTNEQFDDAIIQIRRRADLDKGHFALRQLMRTHGVTMPCDVPAAMRAGFIQQLAEDLGVTAGPARDPSTIPTRWGTDDDDDPAVESSPETKELAGKIKELIAGLPGEEQARVHEIMRELLRRYGAKNIHELSPDEARDFWDRLNAALGKTAASASVSAFNATAIYARWNGTAGKSK